MAASLHHLSSPSFSPPILPPLFRTSLPSSSFLFSTPATTRCLPSLRFSPSWPPPPPAPPKASASASAATSSVGEEEGAGGGGGAAAGSSLKVILEVKDLKAMISESGKEVLRGVNLTIREGEVHAIMGKNGSGKSTFSKVLVGHPDYEVTGGSVVFKGEDLLEMDPEERSHAGLFMSFQTPVEIPGVSNIDFLQMAYNGKRKKLGLPELSPIEFFGFLNPKLDAINMNSSFLNRNVNEGFSGGEKKRNEILQLAVLEAELAILDEIDSGLDIDALQDVANAVKGLLTSKNSVLMITHYQRLLDYITPNYVHIMEDGAIVKTGDSSLAKLLEDKGFRQFSAV